MAEEFDFKLNVRNDSVKDNILKTAESVMDSLNPEKWDGFGEKPESVDGRSYLRILVYSKWDHEYYMDVWLEYCPDLVEKLNNACPWYFVFNLPDGGHLQFSTNEIDRTDKIAESIARMLGFNYDYGISMNQRLV